MVVNIEDTTINDRASAFVPANLGRSEIRPLPRSGIEQRPHEAVGLGSTRPEAQTAILGAEEGQQALDGDSYQLSGPLVRGRPFFDKDSQYPHQFAERVPPQRYA